MTRIAQAHTKTVLIRGEIPDVLKEIPAKSLPVVGDPVRIEIIGTGCCPGIAYVSRVRKNGTYDVNTRGMILADER